MLAWTKLCGPCGRSGCTLQVEEELDFGEGTAAVDLVEGGGSKAVTNENRAQFVEVYVEHLLLKSVEKQRNAFCRGFHKVGTRLRRLPKILCTEAALSILAHTKEPPEPLV